MMSRTLPGPLSSQLSTCQVIAAGTWAGLFDGDGPGVAPALPIDNAAARQTASGFGVGWIPWIRR
jgi:hypothetical protein